MKFAQAMKNELDAAEKILATAEGEGRAMTDEESTAFNDHMGKADAFKANLTAQEDLAAKQGFLKLPAKPPAAPNAGQAPATETDAKHFYTHEEIDPACGFHSIGDYAKAVFSACRRDGRAAVDPRLQKIQQINHVLDPQSASTDPHVESGSAEGEGWMVPPTYVAAIWNAIEEGEDVFNFISPEPTERNEVTEVTDETTPWGTAGIQAYWGAEAAQFTHTKLETGQNTVVLYKLHAFTTASDEILEDAPRLNNRLQVKAPQAILWKASDAIVNGNGVGRPLGWMAAASLVSVTRAGAGAISAADVFGMFSRMLGMRGFWLVHKSTLPQFGGMTIGNQPIYTPPNQGIKEAPAGYLLGYPMKYSEHCQGLGTSGDIQLINPAGYAAYRKSSGIKFASSVHLYFDYDKMAFRWTFRIGGRPRLSAAVSSANGSLSYSHAVVLT